MAPSWFTEKVTPHDHHRHELKKILLRAKTDYQRVTLAETFSFGRCLILNNELQSAERDEFIYHESLVHPAMMLHPKPKEILVLGGGEGATVREILKHPSIKRVTMVDIDRDVVEFCRQHLVSWHRGALHHPKTRLIIADAKKYIAQTQERFDIIVSDLPTPEAGDPVAGLYTQSFYQEALGRLNPTGLLVVQSGSGSWLKIRFHAQVKRTLKKVFKVVRSYYSYVPSFDEPWAFIIASQKADPLNISAKQVDRKLGTISKSLRFYDGQTHEGLFRIPKYLRG